MQNNINDKKERYLIISERIKLLPLIIINVFINCSSSVISGSANICIHVARQLAFVFFFEKRVSII